MYTTILLLIFVVLPPQASIASWSREPIEPSTTQTEQQYYTTMTKWKLIEPGLWHLFIEQTDPRTGTVTLSHVFASRDVNTGRVKFAVTIRCPAGAVRLTEGALWRQGDTVAYGIMCDGREGEDRSINDLERDLPELPVELREMIKE
jgi:hypothetical protein